MRILIHTVVTILAAAPLFTLGCTTLQLNNARVQTETTLAKVLVSDEDEEALGRQVQAELESQGTRYVKDAQVVSYVEGLVNRIAPVAQKDRQTTFKVHVVDDPKTVNAFATPGGHVYVFTGLLLAADDEAQVVGVLAHEIGHVTARHTARQLVGLYGVQVVNEMALGKDPSTLAKVAAAIAGNGALLAHSRASENEADAYAVRYASTLGYDPTGISRFFQHLMANEGQVPRVLTWLSTHPANADRIAHVKELISTEGLRGTEVGADRLLPVKQRLGGTRVSARESP
ncbi:MAG: M48 family metalloprotease [Myxococcaceae bacterium]|nr:M48 family metalloprotease [Myxococcaceae bacterium]